MTMSLRDLIPWNNGSRNVAAQRGEAGHPLLALHREMNRLFDDVFRSFELGPIWLALADELAQHRTRRDRQGSQGCRGASRSRPEGRQRRARERRADDQ